MNLDIALLLAGAFAFVLFSGFVSCIDSAIAVADEIKIAVMMEHPEITDKQRERLRRIDAKRDQHMAAMMVFLTFNSMLSNAMLGAFAYKVMTAPHAIVFMFSLAYCTLAFARSIPKIIARTQYDKILLRYSWIARMIYILMTPMVYMTLVWIDVFKLKSKRLMNLSDLKGTINYYRKEGLIEQEEVAMLQNIMTIKKHNLGDVSQNGNLPLVHVNDDVESCKTLAQSYFGKHIAVHHDDGTIIGALYYHDLAGRLISEQGGNVCDLYRQAVIGYEDENLMEILSRMKETKIPQVVVLDRDGTPKDVVSAKRIYSHILTSKIEQPLAPRIVG